MALIFGSDIGSESAFAGYETRVGLRAKAIRERLELREEPQSFQIGREVDNQTRRVDKRQAAKAYQMALDRDRSIREELNDAPYSSRGSARRRQPEASDFGPLGDSSIQFNGASQSTVRRQPPRPDDVAERIKARLSLDRTDIQSQIVEDCSPLNSPRNRNLREHAGVAQEDGIFSIGLSDAEVKARQRASKALYLSQLDADTAHRFKDRAPARNRDDPYVNTTGWASLQLGSASADMSRSMKQLQHESKRVAQEKYRAALSEQQAQNSALAAMKAQQDRDMYTGSLPYMKY